MGTNYWTSKVLPKLKKVFEKNGTKKAAAAEASKIFDESKEQYSQEFEEKKAELQPKVVEIYEASSVEIKTLVKERKDAGIKKHSADVQKFLDELVKIEFPGSKLVCEACSKFGPAYVSGPVFFVFEKVSTFVVTEEKTEEEAPAATTEAATTTSAEEKPSGEEVKEKEIVVEEEKKEEKKEEEKKEVEAPAETTEALAEPAATAATTESPKVEAAPAAPAPAPAAEPPKA